MNEPEVRITILPDTGDRRGASFQTGTGWLRFLSGIDDAHIAVILPGCVRGNHFHARRREVIAVLHSGAWRAAWDRGAETAVTVRDFSGAGAVLLEVEPGAAHAIANTGHAQLWIVGLSHGAWDPDAPDSFPRVLLPRQAG
jgi:dTDP-4-dehydrorhamnose 3,5-epimerase-like enzyme